MTRVIHEVRLPQIDDDPRNSDQKSRLPGAIARVFIRRNASRQSLRKIDAFLAKTAVGRYAIGQSGSARSGYWPTIVVTERRDLDRLRREVPRLIDGWKELA
jgi:hypothetical protein